MSKGDDPIEHGVREISQMREFLISDFQDQKEFPKEIEALTKAATGYRFALMSLNESGKALSAEFKNFGEKYARDSVYATEFASRALDQTDIENNRLKLHTKLWDEFILPNMNAVDPDSKDFQKIEKKLSTLSQEIEAQAKSEFKDYKKKLKEKKNKGKEKDIKAESLAEITKHKAKLENLMKYWEIWKERRYDFWLRFLCGSFDAQRDNFRTNDDLLFNANWKSVVDNEPNALPDLRDDS